MLLSRLEIYLAAWKGTRDWQNAQDLSNLRRASTATLVNCEVPAQQKRRTSYSVSERLFFLLRTTRVISGPNSPIQLIPAPTKT